MDEKTMNRHERRRQRTRSQLKQATIDLLLEKGYDAITIQDITDRADLGRGTFYIHFKDKADIVWAIVQEGLDETDREARQQFETSDPPPQSEFFGYFNMFQHADKNRDLYRVMLGSQGSAMLTARVQDYLAADLASEMKRYPIYTGYDLPDNVVAQVVTGAIVRLIIWWLETPNDYTPQQMAAMLYEALHHKKPPEA